VRVTLFTRHVLCKTSRLDRSKRLVAGVPQAMR